MYFICICFEKMGGFSRKCFDVNKCWLFLPIAQVARSPNGAQPITCMNIKRQRRIR